MSENSECPIIAAVFATFNRRELALGAIRAILNQNHAGIRAVVVVNAGSDGTGAAIRKEYGSDPRVTMIELEENVGCSSGVRIGMRRAFEDGADWAWILDDDGWPGAGALEKVAEHGLESSVALSALVLDPKQGEMAFPIVVIEEGRERLAEKTTELPEGESFEVRGTWLGALIPRGIALKVGEVDDRLFIRGDDEEYQARIRNAGYRFTCIRGAIVEHPEIVQLKCKIFGKYIFYQPGMPLWKAFYEVRNRIFIRRTFSKNRAAGLMKSVISFFFYLWLALFRDDQRWARFRLYVKAGIHGLIGKLGKTVEPS